VTGGAISTTDRRLTTRPCNLSRAEPSPRRCATRCRPRIFVQRGGRPPATGSRRRIRRRGDRPSRLHERVAWVLM